jgi:Phytanoyl-CoA dioxygenase (PhyH)
MPVHHPEFKTQGFSVLDPVIGGKECDRLVTMIGTQGPWSAGTRRLLGMGPVSRLVSILRAHADLRALLGESTACVQCTLFSKGPTANWSVTAHQDLSVPVRERVDVPGWSGWSRKEGVLFAQPPVEILESLVAVRLQLDDHSTETGPLEVVPGSHLGGRLAASEIQRQAASPRYRCVVPRGGIVAMRPLLIHSSAKASTDGHRRILHFLFGPPSLPSGIHWAEANLETMESRRAGKPNTW